MTPAPIRTSFFGTLSKERAPVELIIVFSSISMPGKGVTSEPEAIKICFVRTVSFEPSFFVTVTSFEPVIEPCPETKF